MVNLKLKELRKKRKLSQVGLALKLNVSQSTISAYEVGERTPDLDTLIKTANFFSVSIDYLVGVSEIKYPIRNSDLSMDEIEHLHIYRQLIKNDKEKVNAYMDGLVGRTPSI